MKEREVMDVFGVSLQVREEACEAVKAAMDVWIPSPVEGAAVSHFVDAAVPVIAGAAYKAGQEEAKARIEDRKIIGAKQRTSIAFNKALDAALAAIDKEGETSE